MKYDVIVLGSGPGGYVAAIRASQLGLKTAVVEKEALGGICLNWGCIPTKALLKSANVFSYLQHAADYGIQVGESKVDFTGMVSRSRGVADGMSQGVKFLMKKNKIDVIMGTGTLLPGKQLDVVAADGTRQTLSAEHILIATGARSRSLPNMPQDGKRIIGYREAMSLASQPKRMVVVGSGAIGVEFAYFYQSIGTEVTIIEYLALHWVAKLVLVVSNLTFLYSAMYSLVRIPGIGERFPPPPGTPGTGTLVPGRVLPPPPAPPSQ